MKHLITSALPYINGIKHLGNLVGSMLPADVYARFLRQNGEEVLFLCATDDHGTPAELAAAEERMPVAQYADKMHGVQRDIYKKFNLSFDHFGRTSSQENKDLTHHFCEKLNQNGLLEKKTIRQIYSIDDKRFLPDRYVVGTCPHCHKEGARGDQCDSCAKLLDPTDLINPRSAISGSSNLELRETSHLFLKQSALVKPLKEWIDSRREWSPLVRSVTNKWLAEGIRDRGITRDLDWGVKVNYPGLENKVFYVWFDAPIGYTSVAQEWAKADPGKRDWKQWWYDTKDDVRYTQFMAKDNIPFHTITYPCAVIGSGEPWKRVDVLKSFNWLAYNGGKFSTSQKRGVFLDQALEEFPADRYRYWLMANVPENSDSDFSWKSFADTNNKDLADVLGNFAVRTTKFIAARYNGVLPLAKPGPDEDKLMEDLDVGVRSYTDNLRKLEYRKAMKDLRGIWSAGNGYLSTKAPWKKIADQPEDAATAINTAANILRMIAVVSKPIIPDTAEEIAKLFPAGQMDWSWPKGVDTTSLYRVQAGEPVNSAPILFEKIPAERVAALEAKYAGKNAAAMFAAQASTVGVKPSVIPKHPRGSSAPGGVQ